MSSPHYNLRLLINNQRPKNEIKNIGNYGAFEFSDLKRLDLYIKGNIFNSKNCCLYQGEIKNNYSTISYKGKKISVLRALYHCYIDNIETSDVLEYYCENPGICVNLKHFSVKNKKPIHKKFNTMIKIDSYEDMNDIELDKDEDIFKLEEN